MAARPASRWDTPQAVMTIAVSIHMPPKANNWPIRAGDTMGNDSPVQSRIALDSSPQPTNTTSALASSGVRSAARVNRFCEA